MAQRILVFSPDAAMGRELVAALGAAAPRVEVELLERYPTEQEISRTDEGRLGAVVVGLTQGPEGLRTLRGFRMAAPEVPAVAVSQSESSEALLEAMRAGATDYLWPPFSEEKLANLLRSLPGRADQPRTNRLFCFIPGQAADGSSTIALHVAHALRRRRPGSNRFCWTATSIPARWPFGWA